MTLHRIDHAVVMDTDHIPGRGGYSLVGISRDVTSRERAFIATNFGISDYLHDPKIERRIFYSSFRIPGGRRVLVRRFARGLRRNQTQNRLYIHTLFLDDDLLRSLHGLPWLLVNASMRLEGESIGGRLGDDVPWSFDGTSLPRLEWDDAADDTTKGIAGRLDARLTFVGNQFGRLPGGASSPADLVARVISAFSGSSRVLLPQGPTFELVTMLAWSMLPPRDREEIAWTQHDTSSVSGVSFQLANTVAADSELTDLNIPAAPIAPWIVEQNTKSDQLRHDFHERAALVNLTIRNPTDIAAWQKWTDALRSVSENLGASDQEIVASMERLAKAAESRPDAPWIHGQDVLAILWQNVHEAVVKKRHDPMLTVKEWASRLDRSKLDRVIFRTAPDRAWLASAAGDVGGNALVWFFLFGTEENVAPGPARTAVAEWLIDTDRRDVHGGTVALLTNRLAASRSPALPRLLDRTLSTEEGLAAFIESLADRKAASTSTLVLAAVPSVLKQKHSSAARFVREVLAPRLDPAKPQLAADVVGDAAFLLRDDPQQFLSFHSRLAPEAGAALLDLVAQWMFHDPANTKVLARVVLQRLRVGGGAFETTGKLAIALASYGEPAKAWFEVLLQMARSNDASKDPAAAGGFLGTLRQLGARPLDLAGALDSVIAALKSDVLSIQPPGSCVRALVPFVRARWRDSAKKLLDVITALINQSAANPWNDIVLALTEDLSDVREISDLVAAFWQKTAAADIPSIDLKLIEAISLVTGQARIALRRSWMPRIETIPSFPHFDRLIELLIREQTKLSPAARMAMYRRKFEQEIATYVTLNGYEQLLDETKNPRCADEVIWAIEKLMGADGAVPRLQRLLLLLRTDDVQPTVRLLAIQRVLPKALEALDKPQWKALIPLVTPLDLLDRLTPSLIVARSSGAAAPSAERRRLLKVYDQHHCTEPRRSLVEGRRTRRKRGMLDALGSFFDFGPPEVMGR